MYCPLLYALYISYLLSTLICIFVHFHMHCLTLICIDDFICIVYFNMYFPFSHVSSTFICIFHFHMYRLLLYVLSVSTFIHIGHFHMYLGLKHVLGRIRVTFVCIVTYIMHWVFTYIGYFHAYFAL